MDNAAVVSERPATVTEAFARDSAGAGSLPASAEGASPETASASAATTEPPVTVSDPGIANAEVTPPSGEPPKERWDAILKNTREKSRQEAIAEAQKDWEPYAWARQVPRDAIEQAVTLARQVQTDPVAFFRQMYEDLDNHPTHAAQLRSEAARLLSRGRTKAVDLSPDVEIVGPDGHVSGRTFSAERMQAVVQQSVQNAVAEVLAREVAPIKSDFEKRQVSERQAAQQRQLEAKVSEMEGRIKRIVGEDDDALKAVAEAMGKPEYAQMEPIDVAVEVFRQRAQQTQTKADANALHNLQRKAAASAVNPATAVVPATRKPRSLTDPSLKW